MTGFSTRWVGAALVAAAVLGAGCGQGGEPGPETVLIARDIPYAGALALDVLSPGHARGAPVVVTVHGCCGTRTDLFQLAHGLASAGAVVFNASWTTGPDGRGYPDAYRQVACAVAFARGRAGAYGGDPARITLVGWSDGALVGAAVALGGDVVPAATAEDGCAAGLGDGGRPDAFVAVGGFLGWPTAAGVVDGLADEGSVRWFGGTPSEVPDAWARGNPYALLDARPEATVRLVVGADDPLLDGNRRFLEAARGTGQAGVDISLAVADGAGNQTLVAPRTVEGKLAVREILGAAAAAAGGRLRGSAPG